MPENEPAKSLWQGTLIRLRAIEPRDWPVYHAWNVDDHQTRALEAIPFPISEESVKRWVEQESTRSRDNDNARFAIVDASDTVVGDLSIHDADPRVGCFSYGFNIRSGYRRRGYAREAVILAIRYFFEERRYQKVTVTVFSFNDASIRLHESLGFQHEGRLRRIAYSHGEHHDGIVFGLTLEEYLAAPWRPGKE